VMIRDLGIVENSLVLCRAILAQPPEIFVILPGQRCQALFNRRENVFRKVAAVGSRISDNFRFS
jgi:hypothetical protein